MTGLEAKDLRIDVFTSGVGCGSYVRAIHIPTRKVAGCGTEKSMLQNRVKALLELERLVYPMIEVGDRPTPPEQAIRALERIADALEEINERADRQAAWYKETGGSVLD